MERAVETVASALDLYGTVYVRKEIVHNQHVVSDLQERGAVFVQEAQEAPRRATLVLSAHGVAPEVYSTAPSSSSE